MKTYLNTVIRKRELNSKQRNFVYSFFNSLGLSFVEYNPFIIQLNSLIRESHRPETFFRTTGVVSKLTELLDGVADTAVKQNGYVPLVAYENFCAYIYRLFIL